MHHTGKISAMPGLNFVLGEAEIAGKRALISLQRLRQEFYGLPQDENLFRERALKEVVHELGHTYGPGSKDIGINRPKNSITRVGRERQPSEKQRGKMLATVLIPTLPGQRNAIAYPRPLTENFFQRSPQSL